MHIVYSSGWLARFADEPNAEHFLSPCCMDVKNALTTAATRTGDSSALPCLSVLRSVRTT